MYIIYSINFKSLGHESNLKPLKYDNTNKDFIWYQRSRILFLFYKKETPTKLKKNLYEALKYACSYACLSYH